MNYFLVLEQINLYFQRVSSLDTKLMASAAACNDKCYNSILQILSEEIIPDYYENNFRNDTKFGRDEIEYEAKQRKFYYDVIEKTNGEDGNEDCEIYITIAGEVFVVQTDKWKNFFLDVVLGKSYHITAPKIYIDDMFNMLEELVQVKYALRGLISIYLTCIGSNVDSGELRNALCFRLLTGGITGNYSYEYDDLLALVSFIQNEGKGLEEWLEYSEGRLGFYSGIPVLGAAEFRNYSNEIVADCKRNLKVEQVASRAPPMPSYRPQWKDSREPTTSNTPVSATGRYSLHHTVRRAQYLGSLITLDSPASMTSSGQSPLSTMIK